MDKGNKRKQIEEQLLKQDFIDTNALDGDEYDILSDKTVKVSLTLSECYFRALIRVSEREDIRQESETVNSSPPADETLHEKYSRYVRQAIAHHIRTLSTSDEEHEELHRLALEEVHMNMKMNLLQTPDNE